MPALSNEPANSQRILREEKIATAKLCACSWIHIEVARKPRRSKKLPCDRWGSQQCMTACQQCSAHQDDRWPSRKKESEADGRINKSFRLHAITHIFAWQRWGHTQAEDFERLVLLSFFHSDLELPVEMPRCPCRKRDAKAQ